MTNHSMDPSPQTSIEIANETNRPANASQPSDFNGAAVADPQRWLENYGDALFRFASLRLHNEHLAEDMVQETLVKAFRGYEKFRHESSERTWLFQILRNEINSHFRSAATRLVVSESSTEAVPMAELLCPHVSVKQFQSAVEKEEFWNMIQRCFAKIPNHLLETFLFRLANPDDKVEQLCEQLGINVSNFSVRLFRTRLLLRKCLESSWFNE